MGFTLDSNEASFTLSFELIEGITDSVSPALILSCKCFSAAATHTSTEFPMSSNSLSNMSIIALVFYCSHSWHSSPSNYQLFS